ncbi:hypothetical protein A2973_04390 [Candidatus Gottesmanbacteria bacterium RIFCSPLOWO2_01_FULL_49_10]|uniref:Antitoxin n=1 Tax=Candidatus Gottesmanbacteria bacterium RIFCSPLOWO2_01_FULL_49_10 TaxID=1798396 RepID=A0A1F6AYD1_9BACT|nr:MAG: hypothetical protein A2973_04390 [Candidatus Gottesmanbacteria bacterium RIFCSPLOWO2_01_FULL_49_10]
MPHTIFLDDINQHLVSLTDFRRNAGRYVDKLPQQGPLTILRGSKVVAHLIPPVEKKSTMSVEERIKKVRELAGGFRYKIELTPKQLNEEYDKMYDEMLPR